MSIVYEGQRSAAPIFMTFLMIMNININKICRVV